MRKTIKTLCLIFAFICMLSSTSVAFASTENVGLTDTPPYLSNDGITTYDGQRPTDVWPFTTKGAYNFSGDTCGNTLYTLYKFTYTPQLKITVTNNSVYTLFVCVIEYKSISLFDKTVASRTIEPGDTLTFTVTDLDYFEEYYVQFKGGGKVSGTIFYL